MLIVINFTSPGRLDGGESAPLQRWANFVLSLVHLWRRKWSHQRGLQCPHSLLLLQKNWPLNCNNNTIMPNIDHELTWHSKNMSEDVFWSIFSTFNCLDSLSDALSGKCSCVSDCILVLGSFKWVQILMDQWKSVSSRYSNSLIPSVGMRLLQKFHNWTWYSYSYDTLYPGMRICNSVPFNIIGTKFLKLNPSVCW